MTNWQKQIPNMKRILLELEYLYEARGELKNDGITIEQMDDLYKYELIFQFLNKNSIYYGQTFYANMVLPEDYPCHAPDVTFATIFFHPNVNIDTGRVCVEFSEATEWSARNTIQAYLYALECLLENPVEGYPENRLAYEYYFTNYQEFLKQVRIVQQFHNKQPSEVQTMPLPNTETFQFERSKFLQLNEKYSEKVRIADNRSSKNTRQYLISTEKRKIEDDGNTIEFLMSGQLDMELEQLYHEKHNANPRPVSRLLYSQGGKIIVEDGVSRRSKTEKRTVRQENYDDISNIARAAARPVVSCNSLEGQQNDLRYSDVL